MSLSPMDKLKIHKELKANKAALSAATKPLEKLQLHKERKALWLKLKVNRSPSEPESHQSTALVIGFSGIDGIQHPDWAHVDNANYEPILTNQKKGFSLSRRRGGMDEDKLYVAYQHGYAGKNFYGATFSSGDAYKLDDITERKGLRSAVDAPHRSMLERAEKQAIKFLGGAFPIEHGGFSITPDQVGYRADTLDGTGLYFGVHKSLGATIADIDSGEAQADIDRRNAEFEAEFERHHQRRKAEKEAGNKASREATESDLAEFFAITEQGMEGSLDMLGLIIHALNESKVKIAGELLEKVKQESKYVLNWDARAYQPLLEALIENEELNLDSVESAPADDPMLEQYREGKFNNQSADKFKETMQQVYELGLPVDEVGSGMINWFNANPDQLAA